MASLGTHHVAVELLHVGELDSLVVFNAFVKGGRVAYVAALVGIQRTPHLLRCNRIGFAALGIGEGNRLLTQLFKLGGGECRRPQHVANQRHQRWQAGTHGFKAQVQCLPLAGNAELGFQRVKFRGDVGAAAFASPTQQHIGRHVDLGGLPKQALLVTKLQHDLSRHRFGSGLLGDQHHFDAIRKTLARGAFLNGCWIDVKHFALRHGRLALVVGHQ